ncbi:MAG: acyl carrier protein [Lachnospiraceae bacterium]|nr:acyl carrier protein [Lachnospiraceae bacterium]
MESELREILEEIRPDINFDAETQLIDGGILDSFDIVTLVAEINARLDIAIPAEELIPENINSAEALLELLERLDEE